MISNSDYTQDYTQEYQNRRITLNDLVLCAERINNVQKDYIYMFLGPGPLSLAFSGKLL